MVGSGSGVGMGIVIAGDHDNTINKITWWPQTQPNGLCMATGYINPPHSTTNLLRDPYIPHMYIIYLSALYIIIMTAGSVQDRLQPVMGGSLSYLEFSEP